MSYLAGKLSIVGQTACQNLGATMKKIIEIIIPIRMLTGRFL